MPTPSIRLTDDVHHAAKHSNTSISKMARQGIEREIVNDMVGICWFCGSGIMPKERHETGGFAKLDQPVQTCSRCLDDLEAASSGERNGIDLEDPYLRRAYVGDNIYDISPSRLPELGIAYGIESTAVWDTSYYRHAAGNDDGSYWAAKSRHEGILCGDRIPLVEVALRSHVFSFALGRPTLPVFSDRLGRATKRAEDWQNTRYDPGPPGVDFSYTDILEEGINDTKFAVLADPEAYCPACGVATGQGIQECDICFHRWEDCPDSDPNPMHAKCSGTIHYEIDKDGSDSSEWLKKSCSDCGKYDQVITNNSVKEKFRQRYLRVFDEIADEHPDIDKAVIAE